jgi:hypothetical protein
MFGSTNKSRLQQQRMRQRTQLASMQGDDDDDDDDDAVAVVKPTNRRAVVANVKDNKPNTVKATGVSFAEPAAKRRRRTMMRM